jgi:pyruvate dehydrogenase complex dehydrogenase (E1) component
MIVRHSSDFGGANCGGRVASSTASCEVLHGRALRPRARKLGVDHFALLRHAQPPLHGRGVFESNF